MRVEDKNAGPIPASSLDSHLLVLSLNQHVLLGIFFHFNVIARLL
jgi:hypothetical protein